MRLEWRSCTGRGAYEPAITVNINSTNFYSLIVFEKYFTYFFGEFNGWGVKVLAQIDAGLPLVRAPAEFQAAEELVWDELEGVVGPLVDPVHGAAVQQTGEPIDRDSGGSNALGV